VVPFLLGVPSVRQRDTLGRSGPAPRVVPVFQTRRTVQSLLAGRGVRPRRRLGQHFLIDGNLMRKLVEAGAPGPDDEVLEVGAGTGSLTAELARRAGRVVAVEVDATLAEIASEQLAGRENVLILRCDALRGKSRVAAAVMDELHSAARRGKRLKLIANLPYDIATPLVLNLLTDGPAFERLCFTVQREVGERFLARAGTAAYGIASVLIGALATARRIAAVPPQAFWPQPRVESVMLAVYPRTPVGIEGRRLAEFVRPFFQQRRKTVARIAATLGLEAEFAAACGRSRIDTSYRPEQIEPAGWVFLARSIGGRGGR